MAIIKFLDKQLVATITGCIAEERASQKRFYFNYYGFAIAVCRKYIWQDDTLQEVVNDAFLKIFRALHGFSIPEQHADLVLKGWMRRILVNTSIDRLRKDKALLLEEPFFTGQEEKEHALTSKPEDSLGYKELLQFISNLSPAYRLVFNLHVLDGYTHDEIAAMLNISAGSSKSNLAKARAKLKKMISDAGKTKENYAERAG